MLMLCNALVSHYIYNLVVAAAGESAHNSHIPIIWMLRIRYDTQYSRWLIVFLVWLN